VGDDTRPGWVRAWDCVTELVGSELDGAAVHFGTDLVELGSIRRWVEMLELDNPAHYDAEAARALGWRDVIAPYSSAWSFVFSPVWLPGEQTAFADPARDAGPRRAILGFDPIPFAPSTTHHFGTGASLEYIRPLVVGERVGLTGRRLIACEPKRTRVGHGAFITVTRDIVNQDLELISRGSFQTYFYNLVPAEAGVGPDARAGEAALQAKAGAR
jgi:N-terminal half of MaoC dehydratase